MWAAALAAALLASVPTAAAAETALRSRGQAALHRDHTAGWLVPTASGEHRVRLCNGFASSEPLEMRRLQEPKLVEYPLPYKACHDYVLPLADGDRLQFRVGDYELGTFAVKGLPAKPSLLLLIPYRSNATEDAIAFQSHIFTQSDVPQVAVVDTYKGPDSDAVPLLRGSSQEELRFSTVVSLEPGKYDVHVKHGKSCNRTETPGLQLVARPQESYVVLRVGSTADSFPESLIVYPNTPIGPDSGAPRRPLLLGSLVALLGLCTA